MAESIEDRVKKVAAEIVGEVPGMGRESRLSDDLGVDSLDAADFVIELEYEFAVVIPDDVAATFKTLGDVCDWLSNQTVSEGSPEPLKKKANYK